jgi:hypothetical protein
LFCVQHTGCNWLLQPACCSTGHAHSRDIGRM